MDDQQELPVSHTDNIDVFLLKEYEVLLTLRQDLVRLGNDRFNFYLTIFAGSVAFFALLLDMNVDVMIFMFFQVVITVLLLSLGITTFIRIAYRNGRINEFSRGMASIRGHFTHKSSDIRKFIILSTDDRRPRFKWSDLLEQQLPLMLALLNSGVLSLSIGALIIRHYGITPAVEITAVLFLSSFATHLWLYSDYIKKYDKTLDKRQDLIENPKS